MHKLIGASLIATSLASPALAQGRLSADSVIAWLPANTETLVVTKGLVRVSDTSMVIASSLADIAAFGPSFSRTRNILEPLHRAHLRFAVEGARAFRPPASLGYALYDGCHIAVFEPADAPLIEEFVRAVGAASDGTVNVGSFNALGLHWHAENDDWSAFVVRLRPNVIIICTSAAMLGEVLERATHGAPARAFASTIPEWSAVDTTAQVWAIRHYGRPVSDPDVKVLDTLAVGVTMSFAESGVIVVHYLSRNPQADSIARQMWAHVSGASFTTDQNGVRISIPPPTDRGSRGILFLIVFGLLGHEIRV